MSQARRSPFLPALLTVALTGCVQVDRPTGPVRSEHKTIDLDRTEMVRVEVRMGAGELKLSGGAEKLLDADFRFSDGMGEPKVRYEATGFRGRLTVESGMARRVNLGEVTNVWNLRLNETKPIDLAVHLGAGENRLDLSRLTLRSLEIQLGAGRLDLDLSGDYKHDFEARIRGGVGQANIRLPRTIGVSVDAKGGIGSIKTHGLDRRGDRYVNAAYGKSPVTLRMEVRGGIGEIDLRVD